MYDMSSDWDALETQATETAAYYLRMAIWHIDENFADGYAMNHPDLVIAFMHICQRGFATSAKNVRHRAEMELREREVDVLERGSE